MNGCHNKWFTVKIENVEHIRTNINNIIVHNRALADFIVSAGARRSISRFDILCEQACTVPAWYENLPAR